MKNFKWQVAVIAFVLTLGLSVGAIYVRQRQMINEPLFKRIGELESVEEVWLDNEDGEIVVTVKLGYVENLAVAYNQLHTEISGMIGKDNYQLKLIDGRDLALETAYLAVHLELYEGEQRGNFAEVGRHVAQTLVAHNVDEHLFTVDHNNIYLQIKKGDAYLFEIIKRQNQGKEGVNV